jgi:DNA repair protein RadC
MQSEIYASSIRNWAAQDRPREKLLRQGPSYLSDSELVAILIQNGTPARSALDLAKEILSLGKNNLQELGRLGPADFMKVKGIGQAKAVALSAALELGRRRLAAPFLQKIAVRNSQDMADYCRPALQDLNHEVFLVAYLNNSNKILHHEIISRGGLTSTVADPRIILKKALEENAVNIVLCHNHPSGNLKPSKADEELTRKIREAARLFDIKVLDHLIISQEGYFSFADEGLL